MAMSALTAAKKCRYPMGFTLCAGLFFFAAPLPGAYAAPEVSFGPNIDYPAGDRPEDVAVGDVNGDGEQDIVTANYSGDTASVLLGNGDGSFGSPTDYPVGDEPRAVALGDLNNDGRLDIVTVNNESNNVSVLRGKSGGGFHEKDDYETAGGPVTLGLGDFDGDGFLDIVTAGKYLLNARASVLLSDEGAGFDPHVDYNLDGNPTDLVVAYLDDDSHLDFALANSGSSDASVFVGSSSGTFTGPEQSTTGADTNPRNIAAGDVDADGITDLVTSNRGAGGSVSVLIGKDDGSFKAPDIIAVGSLNAGIALADVNLDGEPDIVVNHRVPSPDPSSLSVLLGLGSGQFADPVDYATGAEPEGIAIADFNNDKKPDITTANTASDAAGVLLNDLPFLQSLRKSTAPKKIKDEGKTVVNKKRSTTAQGIALRASVRAVPRGGTQTRGDLVCSKSKEGKGRKVVVVSTGDCKLKVTVTYTAKAKAPYSAFKTKKKYKTNRVS